MHDRLGTPVMWGDKIRETPPSLEFLREQVGLVISHYQKRGHLMIFHSRMVVNSFYRIPNSVEEMVTADWAPTAKVHAKASLFQRSSRPERKSERRRARYSDAY